MRSASKPLLRSGHLFALRTPRPWSRHRPGAACRGARGGAGRVGIALDKSVVAAGLVLLAHIHATDLHDRLGARFPFARAGDGELPHLELVWADGAYAGTFARWLETERGRQIEVRKHRDWHLWR